MGTLFIIICCIVAGVILAIGVAVRSFLYPLGVKNNRLATRLMLLSGLMTIVFIMDVLLNDSGFPGTYRSPGDTMDLGAGSCVLLDGLSAILVYAILIPVTLTTFIVCSFWNMHAKKSLYIQKHPKK